MENEGSAIVAQSPSEDYGSSNGSLEVDVSNALGRFGISALALSTIISDSEHLSSPRKCACDHGDIQRCQ